MKVPSNGTKSEALLLQTISSFWLREITLKRSPYNLIFQIDEAKKVIIVFSLFHQKRNPKSKYKDLE